MTRIRFEDLPSTNTPRNADNLNKLNNVVISPTEPTTGEEVWIQKSKNLFNKNDIRLNLSSINANVIDTGVRLTSTITQGSQNVSYVLGTIKELVGKTLTLSCNMTHSASGTTMARFCYLDGNASYIADIGSITKSGSLTKTIENNSNAVYVGLLLYQNKDASTTVGSYAEYTNVQVELGETATSYEPYVDKKIHTKNDNGVYEEFLKEEDTGWISLELKADCSQTLRARKKNGIVSILGTVKIENTSWNKAVAILPDGFAPYEELDIVCRGVEEDSNAHICIIDNTGRIGYLSGVNKNTTGQSVVVNIFATFVQG